MVPSSLRSILSQWKEGEEGEEARPKFLYINPTGANPTGTLLPEGRRREIYQLYCQVGLDTRQGSFCRLASSLSVIWGWVR